MRRESLSGDTCAICSGDGRMLAASIACAVTEDCRGLISFGLSGGLSRVLRTGACVIGSTIISETTRMATDRTGRGLCLNSFLMLGPERPPNSNDGRRLVATAADSVVGMTFNKSAVSA